MYDANTGNQILKIANVPPAALSGNPFSDPTNPFFPFFSPKNQQRKVEREKWLRRLWLHSK